jgi:hypothetical protein
MYTQSTKVHQKLISLPDPLYFRLVKRAKKVGVSLTEYFRLMTYLHLNSPEPFEFIEELDEETSKNVLKAEEEIKAGKGILLKTDKDIDMFMKNLK